MRTDSVELALKKPTHPRRTWHTHRHGDAKANPRPLPPADIIDEAIAAFERVNTTSTSQITAHAAHEPHPKKAALAATLSAQLEALDRQREQLSQLLRTIDETPLDA